MVSLYLSASLLSASVGNASAHTLARGMTLPLYLSVFTYVGTHTHTHTHTQPMGRLYLAASLLSASVGHTSAHTSASGMTLPLYLSVFTYVGTHTHTYTHTDTTYGKPVPGRQSPLSFSGQRFCPHVGEWDDSASLYIYMQTYIIDYVFISIYLYIYMQRERASVSGHTSARGVTLLLSPSVCLLHVCEYITHTYTHTRAHYGKSAPSRQSPLSFRRQRFCPHVGDWDVSLSIHLHVKHIYT